MAHLSVPARRDVAAAALAGAVVLAGTVLVVRVGSGTAVASWTAVLVWTAVAVGIAATAWSWHRVAPVASTTVVVAVVCGYVLAGGPYGPILVLVALAAAAVARHRPARVALATCAPAGAALAATLWTRLDATHLEAAAAVLVAWPLVFVAVPGLAGALVRTRADAAAAERAGLLARGAVEERLRVAREVHDIAGHGFAVVAMQAGVALTVLDEDPVQVRVSLEAIRISSERALGELQEMLRTVRPGAPGAEGVRDLVERVGAGGLPVALTVSGGPEALAPDVSATVYRLVQEALTNVLRHAGPTTAAVDITFGPDDVVVDVRDRGHGRPGPPGGGLRGLRERVERLHGSFSTDARPAAGYRLSARMPNTGTGR